MPDEAAAALSCHPASWRDAETKIDVMLRAQMQRHLDLIEIGKLASAFGIDIDVGAAIRSNASVSDILAEIRDEMILGGRDESIEN